MKILGYDIKIKKSNRQTIAAPREQTIAPADGKRISVPDFGQALEYIEGRLKILKPEYQTELIPVIRKLCAVNPDFGQALWNVVHLANTGHKIKFDDDTPPEQVKKMRQHIENRSKQWAQGAGDRHGLAGRMFSQLMIAGALANEWVPNNNLTGVDKVALLHPEHIRFSYNTSKNKYEPLQKIPQNHVELATKYTDGYKPLNEATFKYIALNGDTEIPYGVPPYLAALQGIATQGTMDKNINYIVEQLGVLGFLQVILHKPPRIGGEGDQAYQTRLETLQDTAKTRVREGFREGITVGYKGDVEFEFQSTAKESDKATGLYELNELMIASGLKIDSALLGRPYGTSETQITVIFTKMLSELKNIQNVVATNLEFGYSLELRLAGYNFKTLEVQFGPSTLTDSLKYQQAQEIKIRNQNALYNDGIIGMEQYAEAMDYDKPDQKKPRVIEDRSGAAKKKKEREDGKNESDKKSRAKKKQQ